MRKKFRFQQFVAKITNFDDIGQNNCVIPQKGKKNIFKNYQSREMMNFTVFQRSGRVYAKNRTFKINQSQEKFITRKKAVNLEFC